MEYSIKDKITKILDEVSSIEEIRAIGQTGDINIVPKAGEEVALRFNKLHMDEGKKEIYQISGSISYCGLVCRLCHLADRCDDCRSENNCCSSRKSEEGCYQYNCCIVKGIEGCWECNIAPCDKGMFSESHDVRLRAFIKYIKENGKDKLAERLYSNMQKGIFYGHGKDYDNLGSIEAVLHKLEGQ